MKKKLLLSFLLLIFFITGYSEIKKDVKASKNIAVTKADPLPSWSDTKVKKDIIAYITNITDKKSPSYIPPEERIATFDNDGTLWAEQPVAEELFIIYYAEKMIKEDPSLKNKLPFSKINEFYSNGKFNIKDRKLFDELVGITHSGMTNEKFKETAREFFKEFKYPVSNKPMSKIVYQPQLELLDYLRANGFKVYICSGGEAEFMRVISKEYYGIPEENVMGSELVFQYDESTNLMTRDSKLFTDNNERAKATNIQYRLGRPSVFAVGNVRSGGDIYMLRFSQASKYPSFQLMINHDDGKREFAYEEKNRISLDWSEKYNWNVVSMKNDWKQIFPK